MVSWDEGKPGDQPVKAGRKKREMRFEEVWLDDQQAQAEAMQYLLDLADRYEASGRLRRKSTVSEVK